MGNIDAVPDPSFITPGKRRVEATPQKLKLWRPGVLTAAVMAALASWAGYNHFSSNDTEPVSGYKHWHATENAVVSDEIPSTITTPKGDKLRIYIDDSNDAKYNKPAYSREQLKRLAHKEALDSIYSDISMLVRRFTNDRVFKRRALSRFEDGMTKQQWLLQQVKNYKFTKIPKTISSMLTKAILGLPAQENRLSDTGESSVGAQGAFQITDMALQDILRHLPKKTRELYKSLQNTDQDPRLNFKTASKLALVHFDKDIYPVLSSELRRLAKIIPIKEQDLNQLTVLLMINAYNAGQGTIKSALSKFNSYLQHIKETAALKGGDKERRLYKYISSMPALEIFKWFTQMTRENSWHKYYGRDAQSYTWLVLAASEAAFNMGIVSYEESDIQNISATDISGLIGQVDDASGYWWRSSAQLQSRR